MTNELLLRCLEGVDLAKRKIIFITEKKNFTKFEGQPIRIDQQTIRIITKEFRTIVPIEDICAVSVF